MSGPGPAIAAKWWPNSTHLCVGQEVVAVLLRVRRRDAAVVEHHDLGREERAVKAIRDRDDAEGRNQNVRMPQAHGAEQYRGSGPADATA